MMPMRPMEITVNGGGTGPSLGEVNVKPYNKIFSGILHWWKTDYAKLKSEAESIRKMGKRFAPTKTFV